MKYNKHYRKRVTTLNIAPTEDDPTPSTVNGTRAMVERFYALNAGWSDLSRARLGPIDQVSKGEPRTSVSASVSPPIINLVTVPMRMDFERGV